MAEHGKKKVMTALLLGLLALGACTIDVDEDYLASSLYPVVPGNMSNDVAGIYSGVWTVDGQRIDAPSKSADVPSALIYHGGSQPYIAFTGFPYEAMVRLLCPEVENFTVAESASSDLALNNVGYSERTIYYELAAPEGSAYCSLPFSVDQGPGIDGFSVVLGIAPGRSTVTIDRQLGVLTCQLVIRHALITNALGQQSLQPDLRLTFTSTERQ